jgi:hypothetical protein
MVVVMVVVLDALLLCAFQRLELKRIGGLVR